MRISLARPKSVDISVDFRNFGALLAVVNGDVKTSTTDVVDVCLGAVVHEKSARPEGCNDEHALVELPAQNRWSTEPARSAATLPLPVRMGLQGDASSVFRT